MTDNRQIMCFDSIDLKVIADSGQCFRWVEMADGSYLICDGDSAVALRQENEKAVEILETFGAKRDWATYFDSAMNYEAASEELVREDSRLAPIVAGSFGLRLLRQSPLETLVTFMMSANNHIPRIKQFVHRLAEHYGVPLGQWQGVDVYAFPSLEALATLTEADFKALGAGYRGRYFEATLKGLLQRDDYDAWDQLADDALIGQLKSLMGVGQKVAECIALFAYGRWGCFPVDTWIKQLAVPWLGLPPNAAEKVIREAFYATYGDQRGLVQQYLFYYYRHRGGLT